ncbi:MULTISPECIES: DUF6123 family protein [Bacillaceae]|uniref:DUF6123 family protein n=1 Tax=Bacillaceae TaxID=186817 RepID=UPI000C76CC6B|nr:MULTISPECIES: DUF6123 family protein [Bacillaceae]PLR66840.1 hypothetical protein CYJ36_16370 [Bacillus sp. UMB0893]QNG61519.1 hypothetical protein H4O14_08605 [Bacillus sp. PAMC26568]
MLQTKQSLADFLLHLKGKGFQLKEDARGFIEFGKHYTGAEDELVIIAIELTLKAQKEFDGSFFVSLLETLTKEKAATRKQAIHIAQNLHII